MASPNNIELLSAAATTGSAKDVGAGLYQWTATGTWDGVSHTLQWRFNANSTWFDIVDAPPMTEDVAYMGVTIAAGEVRGVLTSPGASTSITSRLQRVS